VGEGRVNMQMFEKDPGNAIECEDRGGYSTVKTLWLYSLKGTVPRDFRFQVFS
jgi:hypothetical protein